MNRRAFVQRSLLAGPALLGAGAGYGHYLERHAVEVVRLEVALGRGAPLTVALLSDLHFDPLYETDYLAQVVARTNQLTPDLVLFAGDFLSQSAARLPDLREILRPVQARLGCFAVLGNHDHWVDADQVGAALTAAGITVLRNQSVPLPGSAPWYLTGLESYWGGSPSTASLLNTPPESRHLLLVHEPDSFDLLTDPRCVLQLSGHTHGGQARLPLVGALKLPSWGKNYQAGLYTQGSRRLYVNRGIGTVVRHYRVNCRPEITLLTLT